MNKSTGRLLALKKSLCYNGKEFHDQSISEHPLKKVTFKGDEIYIPEDYLVMNYFGKEIIVSTHDYYSYQTNENQRRNREGDEVKGIVAQWHDWEAW